MRINIHLVGAEAIRAAVLGAGLIGIGSLAFAFAPGLQVAPARPALVVARPAAVAAAAPIVIHKPAAEPAASILAPDLLADAGPSFTRPQRPAVEAAPPLPSATLIPAKPNVTIKSTVAIGADEAGKLYKRAEGLVADGDFAGARLLLERAIEAGHAGAMFMLASTYDPNVLSKVKALGIKGEPEKARQLYQQALAAGIQDSGSRLVALNTTD
ncbi:MAG: hypothetical protein NVSMB26_21960 [Beijerinckiaceae bacterium]